jgi:hypothetical protein
MSSDIAQASNEECTFSNTVTQDLPPNTHLEPPGSDTYGRIRYQANRASTSRLAAMTHANEKGRFSFLHGKSLSKLELQFTHLTSFIESARPRHIGDSD